MNDLLAEALPGASLYDHDENVSHRGTAMRDLEYGCQAEMHALDPEFACFFEEVAVIKNELELTRQLLEKLQDANEESKTIHKVRAMKVLRDRMDEDVAEVTRTVRSIKQKLEQLDKANAASLEQFSSTARARKTMTNYLRKKMTDYMDEFVNLRTRIMGEYRETIERRYYIVTGQVPDENTFEHIIATAQSEDFLQRAIQGQGRGQVLDTIRGIQERQDGVKDLERSLSELSYLFIDMAILADTQGEQIDTIEANMNRAQKYMTVAVKEVVDTKKCQKDTRKWTRFCIILLLFILIIVIIPVLITHK